MGNIHTILLLVIGLISLHTFYGLLSCLLAQRRLNNITTLLGSCQNPFSFRNIPGFVVCQ